MKSNLLLFYMGFVDTLANIVIYINILSYILIYYYYNVCVPCCLSVALLITFAVVCTPDRKWVAYSKLYQSLEVDSSVLFQQLTSIEYHWHQQELPYQQV